LLFDNIIICIIPDKFIKLFMLSFYLIFTKLPIDTNLFPRNSVVLFLIKTSGFTAVANFYQCILSYYYCRYTFKELLTTAAAVQIKF